MRCASQSLYTFKNIIDPTTFGAVRAAMFPLTNAQAIPTNIGVCRSREYFDTLLPNTKALQTFLGLLSFKLVWISPTLSAASNDVARLGFSCWGFFISPKKMVQAAAIRSTNPRIHNGGSSHAHNQTSTRKNHDADSIDTEKKPASSPFRSS